MFKSEAMRANTRAHIGLPFLVLHFLSHILQVITATSVVFDNKVGLGRQFEGIGGISGGGVSIIFGASRTQAPT